MKRHFYLCAFSFCLLLLAACQSPTTAGLGTRVDLSTGESQVRYDDNRLASSLQVLDAVTRHNPDGFIIAQIMVQNLEKRSLPLQYQFLWFDAGGMEISPGKRTWQQKTLHGAEVANLQAVSPYPEAAAFLVYFRRIP
ncbi:MAG: YcfL family protein [Oligosphaeraceae bacterium]|mgnify:CR=1 FL=1|nr:YcfL family protein [Oligosphaeraceae bacterium]